MSEQEEKKLSFTDTVNLPKTDFPIRPNAKVDDPAMIARWKAEDLYGKTFIRNQGQEKFILHDGPPYANGHIHLGHAYNKITKDIVCKVHRMLGQHVPYTPGWDCHGLPIEIKVTQENPGLTGAALKKKCREYAQSWVDIQREEFKNLGILMDWDHPYLTMSHDYEASIVRAFGQFVADGYIEYKNKTVPWCASCQTVLAAAEIEYQDRKDPSIYVEFSLDATTSKKLFPNFDRPVSLLIWTTTPWTLPLNRAVVVRPDTEYVVLVIKGKYVVVGKALAAQVCGHMNVDVNIVAEVSSKIFAGIKVQHPFVEQLMVPILFDQSVVFDDGTACVHSAPGCGPEDYEIAVKNNLEIFSPLSTDGKYTVGIAPAELVGMSITDGQIWVLKKLVELDKLLLKTSIRHSYPHCWRCHNGLMFRATKQWFCDLSRHDLRQKALHACDAIQAFPEKSINRLKATIEGRLEWCLSRQRVWGVPIVAVLCESCGVPHTTQELINRVAQHIGEHGIEYWDTVEISSLLPVGFACPACGGTRFVKERDILDVWFDAGVSHYAVLRQNSALGFPADMYLEGKDQHRGWFQSSLLTGLVLEGVAPMKTLVTHGFTVDDQGRKMSKSLGNVVAPDALISELGTDGLRLWVSSIDMQAEAVVSDILIKNVQQVFRKVRNTCRFLLSNLYDFDARRHMVPVQQLSLIDRHALEQLCYVSNEILAQYNNNNFTAVFHALADYCAVDLSAFYLDIVKDRLYVDQADGERRRSAQTVCWYLLDTITRLIAPILSFTAEQISDLYQTDKKESIHVQMFADLSALEETLISLYAQEPEMKNILTATRMVARDETEHMLAISHERAWWDALKNIRSAILKAIELQREKNIIKHPLEAHVTVYFDLDAPAMNAVKELYQRCDASGQDVIVFFKEFLIVSQFTIAPSVAELAPSEYPGLSVGVAHATGDKCPRCWQWGESAYEHKLCERCAKIVG
jgi:isoleucyl-tRNA synthetase